MKRATGWLLLVLVPLEFVAIWQLQRRIDVQLVTVDTEQEDILLRSPKLMKFLSMEFAPLMADVYWTRAVQYYGSKHLGRDKSLGLLWPFLDIATTLDPQLLPAYRFGAIFLSQRPPGGAGEPQRAIELMERGIAANPGYWRLYQDLGYIYYFDLKDYKKASEAFLEGSRNADAAPWMKIMAAKIAEEGQSLNTSTFLWSEIYRTTKDENVKQNAELHLKLIRSQEDCGEIDRLSAEYQKRVGHSPATMRELVQAGLLRGVPLDPDRYPYVIGDDGKAQLNPESPLFEKQALIELFKNKTQSMY